MMLHTVDMQSLLWRYHFLNSFFREAGSFLTIFKMFCTSAIFFKKVGDLLLPYQSNNGNASSAIQTLTDLSATKKLPQPSSLIGTFSKWPQISTNSLPACFFPISMILFPVEPLVRTTAHPDPFFSSIPSLVQPIVLG